MPFPPSHPLLCLLVLLRLMALSSCTRLPTSHHRPRASPTNPIIADGTDLADPAILEWNGTLYLYPTGNQRAFRVYTHTLANISTPTTSTAASRTSSSAAAGPQTCHTTHCFSFADCNPPKSGSTCTSCQADGSVRVCSDKPLSPDEPLSPSGGGGGGEGEGDDAQGGAEASPGEQHSGPTTGRIFGEGGWVRGPIVYTPPRTSCLLNKIDPALGNGTLAWAPHVIAENGRFYMYYSTCYQLGVAVAPSPLGPFVAVNDALVPWALDPFVYRDAAVGGSRGGGGGGGGGGGAGGGLYLLYGRVNPLHYLRGVGRVFGRRMANATALAVGEKEVELLVPDQHWWEYNGSGLPAGINEGPWVLQQGGVHHLMYSGASASSQFYRLGVATSASPLGPYTKAASNPIIEPTDPATSLGIFGPGHHAVWRDGTGQLWAFYHQKRTAAVGWDRFICVDALDFDNATGAMALRVTRG